MTSDIHNPWTNIRKPISGFNVLRVDPEHPHDFFWGRDTQGSFLMLLKIDEKHTEYFEKGDVELKGVKTDIRLNHDTEECFFILCLQHKEDFDIFHRLCTDLIERTKDIKSHKEAFSIIHNRLKRWRKFLSKKIRFLLTDQEVHGLYAELEFLHTCISITGNHLIIIEGWKGPLGGPHDFIFGDYAIEIKSVSGSQKDKVRISSENQLLTHLERLYLQIFFLAEFHDCKKGLSLNAMVNQVRDKINDADHRDLFDSKLHETGYLELKEYDAPCYKVTHQKTFEVKEYFPRITPDLLSEGLTNVSYDLDLNSLSDFACEFPFSEANND